MQRRIQRILIYRYNVKIVAYINPKRRSVLDASNDIKICLFLNDMYNYNL